MVPVDLRCLNGVICFVLSIQTDNYSGMKALCEHIIGEHGARNIIYMGGPKEHPENMIRLQALRDTVDEHQVLPEAVICANDIMAMGICDWVKENGYEVLVRNIDIVLKNSLYSWTRHMIQDLEHFRRKVVISQLTEKVKRISVTDNLTDVYNRAGCEEIAYPMLKKYQQAGKTGVLMIADIDRMKAINDFHGHACGDLALKTVAYVLKSEVPENWIVARFGGDEFLVAGILTENMDMDQLVGSMLKRLQDEIEKRKIAFPLSVSIGYAKIYPEDEFDIERSVQKADQFMYSVKEEHHKEEQATV